MATKRNRRRADAAATTNNTTKNKNKNKAKNKAKNTNKVERRNRRKERRAAGKSKEVGLKARDVAVNADSNWLLYKLGWTGTVDEFIEMMKASQGEIEGLERFRTSGGEEFSVHLEAFDGDRDGASQAKVFQAAAEINEKWRPVAGRSLVTLSAGG